MELTTPAGPQGAGAAGPLHALSYVVVDVETTGMRPWHGDRVTEVAAVVVRAGAVVERFTALVNPERPIPPRISALTHITNDMVRAAPPFRDICAELLPVMAGHVFVAHNAAFDWRFLSAEVARARRAELAAPRLCTVRLARRLLPALPSRRLEALAQHYGVTVVGRHRALGDAEATAHILLRLLEHAEREHGCTGWAHLDALQRAARGRGRRWYPPVAATPEVSPGGAPPVQGTLWERTA